MPSYNRLSGPQQVQTTSDLELLNLADRWLSLQPSLPSETTSPDFSRAKFLKARSFSTSLMALKSFLLRLPNSQSSPFLLQVMVVISGEKEARTISERVTETQLFKQRSWNTNYMEQARVEKSSDYLTINGTS